MSKRIQNIPIRDQTDRPNGGFPPLYVCDSDSNVDSSDSDNKIREFANPIGLAKVPESVPIHEILAKRSKGRFFFD